MSEKRNLLKKLSRYSVSLYRYQYDALDKARAVHEQNGIFVLDAGFYDSEFGVNLDGHHEFLCV
jgi:hypothetical protein